MKKTILLLLTLHGIFTRVLAQETIIQYLSGKDKDHTTPWEFFVTKGRNSGTWTSIPVPSLWDQQGFGNAANGGKDKSDEKGIYRVAFPTPKEWQSKKVFLVFEGVMTDADIKLNGKPAGDAHQGAFSQFSFDISPLIRFEEPNLLEITVSKQSANASVNQTERRNDFAGSGGIYRPVYLKVVPNAYVERVAIDAKANGNLKMQVVSHNTQPGQFIELQVKDMQGKDVGDPIQVSAADNAEIKKQFSMIKTWNPELPHLYDAVVSVKDASQQVLHSYHQQFGFRTVETKSDGIYVNDTKVVFKGLNRRNAELGLMSTPDVYAAELNMMKDLNMNAVRLSYFPPDPDFLDMCDSLGLFVIDEMSSGSQAAYDAETGKRVVKELVQRDINHPSVIVWSYGNENASSIDNEYRSNDIQQRMVIHPVVKNDDSKKNADFNFVANSILYGTETYYPSEFANGLYNGGRAAGLDNFWTEMVKQSKFSGGFLWSYLDDNNAEPATSSDAIIKQRSEKGPSYYAIKEIWSPVAFDVTSISSPFSGNLNVENRFLYTNLNKCRFDWKLILFPKATQKTTSALTIAEGTATSPYTGPGEKGVLKLTLPAFGNADALLLSVYDAKGREICTWTWPIHQPTDIIKTIPEVASISTIMRTEDDAFLSLVCDGINYIFDKKNGNLTKVYCGKRDIPFLGPFIAGVDATMTDFKHTEQDRVHTVEVTYKGDNYLWVRWTFKTGDLPKMEYQYSLKGSPVDYAGITFKYPEEKIVGMKWFGRGPWQVWKNRMKGEQLGVWEKSNKPGASGEPAKNADIKGWHSDIYWVQFQTNMGNFTIYNDQSNVFLQLFNPLKQANVVNEFNHPPFPENGNISFMHGISSFGTKFVPSEKEVSKSLKSADEPLSGTLWIDFRW